MRSNLTSRGLVILVAMLGTAPGQTQEPAEDVAPPRRIVLKPATAVPPPPAQPEPGDGFQVDAAEREIVIDRGGSGGARRFRIPLNTSVEPAISSRVELSGGQFQYRYSLTNGPGAKRDIELFAVGTPRPELCMDARFPSSFRSPSVSSAAWGTSPRLNFWAQAPPGLAPGQSAGPFSFHSPLLPGLTKAYVMSSTPPRPTLGEMRLSAWLLWQLEEALKFENNTVQPAIVGPKIEKPDPEHDDQLAEAIRQEFLEASLLPEFKEQQVYLRAIAAQLSKGASTSAGALVDSLKTAGNTPLQKSFFEAMALNLTILETLR